MCLEWLWGYMVLVVFCVNEGGVVMMFGGWKKEEGGGSSRMNSEVEGVYCCAWSEKGANNFNYMEDINGVSWIRKVYVGENVCENESMS